MFESTRARAHAIFILPKEHVGPHSVLRVKKNEAPEWTWDNMPPNGKIGLGSGGSRASFLKTLTVLQKVQTYIPIDFALVDDDLHFQNNRLWRCS